MAVRRKYELRNAYYKGYFNARSHANARPHPAYNMASSEIQLYTIGFAAGLANPK